MQTPEEITTRWTEYCQELFTNTSPNVNAEHTSVRKISPKQNACAINDQFHF